MADETLTEIIGNEALTADLSEAQVLVMRGMKGEDGADGHSLRVNSAGHVEYYDDTTQQWVDTGIEVEGVPGPQGDPGDDGYSPTVTTTAITGGTRVTITDANGSHSFDVMDGEDGAGVPEVTGANVGQVMTVGAGGTWVAADAAKQVQFFKYYPEASSSFPAGAVTVTVAGTESRTSGLAIANAISGGVYPLVIENGNSPNLYRPVDVLPGTSIVFKSHTFSGDELTLSIPWEGDNVLAALSSNIGVLPTVNAQTDVGKVPTVNSSGGYTLQTPSGGGASAPFEIPVTQSGSAYTTTASASDILSNADNLVLTINGAKIRCSNHDAATFYFDYLTEVMSGVMIEAARYIVTVANSSVSVTHELAVATGTDALPTVTTTDNGKFLRVVSGAWAAQAVPSAESNSFGGGS